MNDIELLAPVGKLENVYAAVENGADAVFLGGKSFNARHAADNFERDTLKHVVEYCHLRGVAVHVTMNILIEENEVSEALEELDFFHQIKVDAVIVQDFGLARLIRRYFPHLKLHASTQLSAHSIADVKFLERQGFDRVVLARELTLQEIDAIKQNTTIELETFIHGALCYAYSGQCLTSSLIGARSGNRGQCAQPCRMQYTLYRESKPVSDQHYMLSTKDICTLDIMDKLIEIGIHSFKIEGRMKSPEYVAATVQTYRKAIDQVCAGSRLHVDEHERELLLSVFNRGGFSKGYYLDPPKKEMLADDSPKHIGLSIGHVVGYDKKTRKATFYTRYPLHPGDGLEIWNKRKHVGTGVTQSVAADTLFTCAVNDPMDINAPVYLSKNHTGLKHLRHSYHKSTRQIPIQGECIAKCGQPVVLTLRYQGYHVTVEGEVLLPASNRPVTEKDARKQLLKTGNTPFRLHSLDLQWEEGFIPNSQLNQLRRCALEALEREICAPRASIAVNLPQTPVTKAQPLQWTIGVWTLEQLDIALACPSCKRIYWEWRPNQKANLEAFERCQKKGISFYLALPFAVHEDFWTTLEPEIAHWGNNTIDGFLVRQYGLFESARATGKSVIVDYSLNSVNHHSVDFWAEQGALSVTMSLETPHTTWKYLPACTEKVVYGHFPVMTSKHCVLGHYGMCNKYGDRTEMYTLQDRKDTHWPIRTSCESCHMQIYSYLPIYEQIDSSHTKHFASTLRIAFTFETGPQTHHIINHFIHGEKLTHPVLKGRFATLKR